MTKPGMLFDVTDVCDRREPRRSVRSKFITRLFAVGIGAALLGGGVAIVQQAPQADAITQTQINRYIKSEGGIPPCTHEDGSGQPGPCYWNAKVQGNGDGWSFIAMPDGKDKGDDKDLVYLNGPKAVRY